jgi:hypothetical protein
VVGARFHYMQLVDSLIQRWPLTHQMLHNSIQSHLRQLFHIFVHMTTTIDYSSIQLKDSKGIYRWSSQEIRFHQSQGNQPLIELSFLNYDNEGEGSR